MADSDSGPIGNLGGSYYGYGENDKKPLTQQHVLFAATLNFDGVAAIVASVICIVLVLGVLAMVIMQALDLAGIGKSRMTSSRNLLDTSASASTMSTVLSASNQGSGTNRPAVGSPNYSDEAAQVAAAQLAKSKQAFRSRFFHGRANGPSPRYVPPYPPAPKAAEGSTTERMSDADLTSRMHGLR